MRLCSSSSNQLWMAAAAGALAATLFAGPAKAQVLTFEDIPSNATFGSLDAGYTSYSPLGFTLTGWCFQNGRYPTASGTYSLYNSDNCEVGAPESFDPTFYLASGFGVNSVWLDDYDVNPNTVNFLGYLGGNLVASQFDVPAVGGSVVTFGSNFANIDTWRMVVPYDYFAFIDDLNVNTNVTPEPATLVLLGTGLLGIGGVVRRRRKSIES